MISNNITIGQTLRLNPCHDGTLIAFDVLACCFMIFDLPKTDFMR